MNVLITIPARKGSKGLKDKNLREINGKSLIDLAVHVSHKSGTVIVSSDIKLIPHTNYEIYHYDRPADLCTDQSLAWDVWQDAVKTAEWHFKQTFDYHLYLEPTSPCRTPTDLTECLSWLRNGKSSVCTLSKTPPPQKAVQFNNNQVVCMDFDGWMNNRPRQAYGEWYKKNGICYGCTDRRMKSEKTMLDPTTHYVITERTVVNIDTEEDLKLAADILMAL